MRHTNENWRRFEAMARRGFGRFAGGWDGNIGGFGSGMGGNFRIGRMLASGDLRLVALYLIEEQPRHGYDLIKAIEERSHGFYAPSPGVVYPALTYLEEAGYVTSTAEGNKKSYTITDEGRAHLADNREAIESTLEFLGKAGERMGQWRDAMSKPFSGEAGDRNIADVIPEVNDARRNLKRALRDKLGQGEETQRAIAAILHRAANDINALNVGEPDIDLD